MKKKALSFVLILLALAVLAGCGAEEPEYSFEYVRAEMPALERCSFDEIEYVRPDMDAMYEVLARLLEVLDEPQALEEITRLLDEFRLMERNFSIMYTLADIRCSLDTSDEYYDNEYSWCMEKEAELVIIKDELYGACLKCENSSWLEENYFCDGFDEDYSIVSEAEVLETYLSYLVLTDRKTELLDKYRDVVAEPSITVDGRERNFAEYVQQADYEEYVAAVKAYYEKYGPILGQIYIELLELRREEAKFMECGSVAEMEYEHTYGRDYSPEEAEAYLKHVKTYMAELGRDVKQAGLEEKLFYDPVDERELELYLETLAEMFGGSIEQAYELMKQYSMYDFSLDNNKAETSFQTYLSGYEIPFLFLCPYGNTEDITTLCHEFGHYADAFIRQNADESIDLAEVYSQTMQLMSIDALDCVMIADEYENYRMMNLTQLLSNIQLQSALAEFELRAHEMENPNVEKLNELNRKLLLEYGVCTEEEAEDLAASWIDIIHLFESPFYVISYSVSATVALEIYEAELVNEGSGIEQFIRMSESQIPGLMEAVEYAGLSNPLLESNVKHTAAFLRSQLFQ